MTVLIIGGGIVGLATAYRLLEKFPAAKVTLLEKEQMDSPPFPCALVAVKVEEVRDHGAAGVTFHGPRYSFQAGKEHRKNVEESVFAELKGPAPTV